MLIVNCKAMLVKKVKLTEIGEIVSYPKKENGNIVKTADGKDVMGNRRQVVFESLDFRKDSFPFMLFNEEVDNFNFEEGKEGELHFQCESRESKTQESGKRYYAEFRLIDFIPTN